MKRIVVNILAVIGLISIVGVMLMYVFTPRVSNTFSTISSELPADAPVTQGYGVGGGPIQAPAMPAPLASADSFKVSRDAAVVVTNNPAVAQERKIIQNADLSIVVKDPVESMKEIDALARQLGGYFVSSQQYQSPVPNGKTVPEATISIRVPSEKLGDALEQIKEGALEVRSENRSGQDVTDQYVDLKSRLKVKQSAEAQLEEIMKKADKTEDVLAVYMQLQQIQTEIEMLQGQINLIDQSAAMSLINVHLVAEAGLQPIQIAGWKPQGVANDAIEKLVSFLQGFGTFLINFFLFYIWVILLSSLFLYVMYRFGLVIYNRMIKPRVMPQSEEAKK